MQHIFIINPTAGKVDASVALIPQIHAAASRAGLHPTIEVTTAPGRPATWPPNTPPAGKKYTSTPAAATAR